MKRKITLRHIIIFVSLVIGVGALAYPKVSNFVVNYKIKKEQEKNDEIIKKLPEEEKLEAKEKAEDYNRRLAENPASIKDFFLSEEEVASRNEESGKSEENGSGNSDVNEVDFKNVYGIKSGNLQYLGKVVIPKINVNLPIYEGTSEEVLTYGAGHLKNSSLPIGGPSTHTILAAHSGLKNAEYFTNLRKLKDGDVFYIENMSEVLEYRVIKKETILPDDIENMGIVPGKDYATLVTCTPIGLNTHRLLVLGERIKSDTDISNKELNSAYKENQDKNRKSLILASAGTIILAAGGISYLKFRK